MVDKNVMMLNLNQLKIYLSEKHNVEKSCMDFYRKHLKEINDTYFYYKTTNTYCRICSIANEVLEGGLQYTEYFIGMNYHCHMPQIFERSHTFKIRELPIDEIEILSKEEFVAGLKKQLQDALDNM